MVQSFAEFQRHYGSALMNHSSGLVRYEFNPKFIKDLNANPDRVWKPEELILIFSYTKSRILRQEKIGIILTRITSCWE
ncbi:MAG: hypothetical protein HC846_10065 [Blastocatellia bacterium]|nr:hypothetical protein [Blastocatellia bacterium]